MTLQDCILVIEGRDEGVRVDGERGCDLLIDGAKE